MIRLLNRSPLACALICIAIVVVERAAEWRLEAGL